MKEIVFKKLNKKRILVALIIVLIASIFCVGIVLASTGDWLKINMDYVATSSNDLLSASVDDSNSQKINVSYTAGQGDCHFTKADILIISQTEITQATFTNATQDSTSKKNSYSQTQGFCYCITNLLFTQSFSLEVDEQVSQVYVFPAEEQNGENVISYANTYIDSFFALEKVNVEKKNNPSNPKAVNGSYHTLFMIAPFIIDKNFSLNLPADIHLFSDITLKKNFEIQHNYGGYYGLYGEKGVIKTENASTLKIHLPYAYYYYLESAITCDKTITCASFSDVSGNLTSSLTAQEAITSLISQAENYILEYIPTSLKNNLVLPTSYKSSGIFYAYNITQGEEYFSKYGVIYPDSSTQEVTVEVTIEYQGYYKKMVDESFACSKTVSVPTKVMGSSDFSIASAILEDFNQEITTDYLKVGERYYFSSEISFLEILKSYKDTSRTNSISFTVADLSGSKFTLISGTGEDKIQGKTNKFTLTKENNIQAEIVLENGESKSFSSSLNEDSFSIFFTPSLYMVSDDTVTIGTKIEENSKSFNYKVQGMTKEEVKKYLESIIETPNFSADSKVCSIIGLIDEQDSSYYNAIYSGNSLIFSNRLGIKSLDITVIKKDVDTVNPQEDWAVMNSSFTFTPLAQSEGNLIGGTLTAKNLASGEKYYLLIKITFSEEDVYYTYRKILFPSAGLGGTDTTQYIKGNTFSDFYDTLSDGKLLQSNLYKFSIQTSGISIFLTLDNKDISEYCYIVYKKNEQIIPVDVNQVESYEEDGYYIYIDIDKLPSINQTTNAVVYFYYTAKVNDFMQYAIGGFEGSNESCFTIQKYAFTLPGIYKCGENKAFCSQSFYDFLLNVKDDQGNYVYDAYRKTQEANGYYYYTNAENTYNNYLYVDGTKAECDYLDASLITKKQNDAYIYGYNSTNGISLKGIEYLSHTKNISFAGVKINDVTSLKDNTVIVSLNLSSCNLSDTIVDNNLSHMSALISIDLSFNRMTKVDGILYRTVSYLNLGYQQGYLENGQIKYLTSIAGIEKLNNLCYINLAGNKIDWFGPLKDLSSLKMVVVASNESEKTTEYQGKLLFGTNGSVNIPVFVSLMNIQEAKVITLDNYVVTNFYRQSLLYTVSFKEFASYDENGTLTLTRWNVHYYQGETKKFYLETQTIQHYQIEEKNETDVASMKNTNAVGTNYNYFTAEDIIGLTVKDQLTNAEEIGNLRKYSEITSLQQEAALVLNAVEYLTVFTEKNEIVQFNKVVKWNGNGTEYNVSFVNGFNQNFEQIYNNNAITIQQEEFYFMGGVTITNGENSVTLCAIYIGQYKGALDE